MGLVPFVWERKQIFEKGPSMPNIPKLLVVDDSQAVRISVKRILTKAGYEVITANDGFEALDRLNEEPSLMVLDVNMPGMDGYGVCEKMLEAGEQYKRFPVVFLTSVENKALEMLGNEFGAYLNKPVSEQELLTLVKNQLALAAG